MTELQREDIERILPHRDAMLLVDRISIDGGTAVGETRIGRDAWYLRGHFPGNPVVPGVVLCEMMAQAGCVFFGSELASGTPYFAGIDRARFRHPVVPGDTFRSVCTVGRDAGYLKTLTAKGYVNDTLCVDATMSFVIREDSEDEMNGGAV